MVSAVKWGSEETQACRQLVALALAEDLDSAGDLTSKLLFGDETKGQVAIVARAEGVVAGLPAVETVYEVLDKRVRFDRRVNDGARVLAGKVLGTLHGPVRSILTGERTALNFMQRLSGVATLTRHYVDAIAGLPGRILDTRKTTPGWRRLEKYAVRCGGGFNHRLGLFDGILIKDNHLAALASNAKTIQGAVEAARKAHGSSVPIEVEVEGLRQLEEALTARPDIILLDNMSVADLEEAVRRRNQLAPEVQLEASGGISLQTVRQIAETGVERVSVGALTHSAPALDIAMDYSLAPSPKRKRATSPKRKRAV